MPDDIIEDESREKLPSYTILWALSGNKSEWTDTVMELATECAQKQYDLFVAEYNDNTYNMCSEKHMEEWHAILDEYKAKIAKEIKKGKNEQARTDVHATGTE